MTITRSDLRKDLQNKGFTYRDAKRLINTIIDIIIEKLRKGDTIDTPLGQMTWVRPKPNRAYKLGKIVKTHTKPKVHFRRKD